MPMRPARRGGLNASHAPIPFITVRADLVHAWSGDPSFTSDAITPASVGKRHQDFPGYGLGGGVATTARYNPAPARPITKSFRQRLGGVVSRITAPRLSLKTRMASFSVSSSSLVLRLA